MSSAHRRTLLSAPVLPCLLALLPAALVLFGHLDALPIRLWDESRLAFNALDMSRHGHWLVPRYDGVPDMWNTKPPLMVWLEAVCIKIAGPSELAVRLPAALAAFGTCVWLFWYGCRRLMQPWLGALSVGLLVCFSGYVSLHGTRTGDYDSLLVFFTTGCGLLFLSYLHTQRSREWYLSMLCMALGMLTKGIAALMIVPGLLLFACLDRRLLFLLKSRHAWLGLLLALAPVVVYYLGREQINPGYLQAVWNNELGGRFGHVIENHEAGFWSYFNILTTGEHPFMLAFVAAGLLAAGFAADPILRRTAVFAATMALVFLLVISCAQTKLSWYALPAYPLLALLAAMGFRLLFCLLQQSRSWQGVLRWNVLPWLLLLLLIPPYRQVVDAVLNQRIPTWELENNHMAEYLQQMAQGRRSSAAPCFLWDEYALNLDWYLDLLRDKGQNVAHVSSARLRSGMTVAAYQQGMQSKIDSTFRADTLEQYHNVIVYRLGAKR